MEELVLQGYIYPLTKLWCAPLKPVAMSKNENTLLLDSPCGTKLTNSKYRVPPTTTIREHIKAVCEQGEDTTNNVYELLSMEQLIQ